jgi:tetratricopeptide (TPR) repeat protein
MNKTRKLEKKWYQYRLRKILSFSLLIGIAYTILALGYYFLFKVESFDFKKIFALNAEKKSLSVESNNTAPLVALKNSELNQTLPTTTSTQKEKLEVSISNENILLEPIIPIIDFDQEQRHVSAPRATKKVVPPNSNMVRAKASNYLTAKELSHLVKEDRDTTKLKNIHLHSSSRNYIETMENKFLKSKSPRDALLLAKAYYGKGYFKESEKWALQANSLDSDLEESWIIFAKAKVKLGKKDEAIQILSTYYKKSKNIKARLLIEKIKKGKL